MGSHKIVVSLTIVFLLVGINEGAKKRFKWGFMDGKPLREHYAIQAIGADGVEDCYEHPENYGVQIFNFTQPLDNFDPDNKATWQQVRIGSYANKGERPL